MTRAQIKTAALIFGACLQASSSAAVVLFPGVTGRPLIDSLRLHYKSARILAYAGSPDPRDTLFGEIYLTAADSLECVYSGYTIYMQPGQDPDDWAFANDINCEHTWPQSLLNTSQTPNPTGDMHHLFPTRQLVNADRGNSPFAEITDDNTQYWYYKDIERSTVIPSSNIDGYAEVNLNVGTPSCEPREMQQGNTARAMFYMLTMYQLPDTTLSWWTGQKHTLRNWHIIDPADGLEVSRTWLIAAHQQNKPNPFVIDSSLVDRCYFPDSLSVETRLNFAPISASHSEAAGTVSLAVIISSPSVSSGTTVDVVLAGGTGSAADVNNYSVQTLTFPAGSSAPETVQVTITDDSLVEEAETIVFKLRNASGGDAASLGADSAFTLTIEDNDRTVVSFDSPAASTRTEGDAPFDMTVAIANPSGSGATTADVVLASGTGSAEDINNYTTQTVTFPAGSFSPQIVQITITDDVLIEGEETLVFKLRNVSGGNSAAAGSDSAYTLTISDNDAAVPGPFTETMGTVPSTTAIATHEANDGFDNDGLTMSGTADVRSTLPSSGYTGASGGANIFITNTAGRYFLIEGINTLSKADYTLSFGMHKSTTASNGSDLIVEVSSDGASYAPLSVPALPTGTGTAIWYFRTALGTIPSAANLRLQFRQSGTATQYRIDDVILERVLGAGLSGFSASTAGDGITLYWLTECENDSYMWIVERSQFAPGPYAELARLPAAGTSTTPRDYSWTDNSASPGATHYYRLGELGLDGRTTYYGPVSCSMGQGLPQVDLSLGCVPNPFRTTTSIRYQVSKTSPVVISLYNVSGQLVKRLDHGLRLPGWHQARWDGTDECGRKLSAGVYLYRISIGGRQFGGKAQLVR